MLNSQSSNQDTVKLADSTLSIDQISLGNESHCENSLIDQNSWEADSGRGSSIDLTEDLKIGSIHWAQFSKKCWWPCIIAPDPASGRTFANHEQKNKAHIRYLADYRRSWIEISKLNSFVEIEQFQKTVNQKFNTKRKTFCEAVSEAGQLMQIDINFRLDKFEEFQQSRKNKVIPKKENNVNANNIPSPAIEPVKKRERKLLKTELDGVKSGVKVELKSKENSDLLKKKAESLRNINPEMFVKNQFIYEEFSSSDLTKLKKGEVCCHCHKPNAVLKCKQYCKQYYHEECDELLRSGIDVDTSTDPKPSLDIDDNSSDLVGSVSKTIEVTGTKISNSESCFNCGLFLSKYCFICKIEGKTELIKCHYNDCGKLFHRDCLNYFPKLHEDFEKFICSHHFCNTCYSRDIYDTCCSTESKLVKCILCPSSYHFNVHCVPAGSEFITGNRIFCTDHKQKKTSTKINVNWCFLCGIGGELICCDTCPVAIHQKCLKLPVSDNKYVCDFCESGRRPLYNELVWAKLGNFRFWPAIIVPPNKVPDNLISKAHSENQFCVKFFGSLDYAWIEKGRVYLYLEGDSDKTSKLKVDKTSNYYQKALKEVKIAHQFKKQKVDNQPSTIPAKPLPYVKIKTNQAVPPVKLRIVDQTDESCDTSNEICLCDENDKNPCGYNTDCLNRHLYFECSAATCPAADRCENQNFTKQLYSNLELKFVENKGFGLFTKEKISQGTFVIEYVGEVISGDELNRRMKTMEESKKNHFYFMELKHNVFIDAGPKGNLARFINHSCDPNCETQVWTVNKTLRIGIFAIRDIDKGEEVTFNYKFEAIGNGKKVCFCGANNCTGFIGIEKKTHKESGTKRKNLSDTMWNENMIKKQKLS